MSESQIENLERCERTLKLEKRADGRAFVVVGNNIIARKFIVRVHVEYVGFGSDGLYVETAAGRVTIAELDATPPNRARLRALAEHIIELWMEE